MVRAWYIVDNPDNPKSENHQIPPKFISLEEFYAITGVEYHEFDITNYQTELGKWRKQRKLDTEIDILILDDIVREYYEEHLHEDDDIEFVLEGCCYFDVRDDKDQWIRLEILPGDCIIIPKGCYHRFTTDEKNVYAAKQFLPGDNTYSTHYRPADNLKCRTEYLAQQKKGFQPKN